MSEKPAEPENNSTASAEQLTDTPDVILESAFTPNEASFRIFLETYQEDNSHKVASYAELQAEISDLKQQLESAKEAGEQQKYEADSYKKQVEELELKLKTATGHVCQCVTASNARCTKVAHKTIKHNGLVFWICKQHQKQYPDAETVSEMSS